MTLTPRSAALVFLLCGTAAGCGFDRPGAWRAPGSNEANLRAMLVDPADAARGRGTPTARGVTAGQAVIRLDEDRRRPLPDSRAAQIGALGGQSPGGTPAPTAPANAN